MEVIMNLLLHRRSDRLLAVTLGRQPGSSGTQFENLWFRTAVQQNYNVCCICNLKFSMSHILESKRNG